MWLYVERDGDPKEPGFYWCTLLADVIKDGEPTGRKVAYSDLRSFEDVTNISDDYRMVGQPLKGMGWTRDADGFKSETVYAWSPDIRTGVSDIPEGTMVIKRTDHDD